MLVWRCHHLLFGFIVYGHLPRGSRQSLLLDKDEVKRGAVNRSLDIFLTIEETPGNPQLGDYLKAV